MRRALAALLPAVLAPVLAVPLAPPAAAQEEPAGEVTVLTRNLYLGADIGIALDLLPDLAAAAQFMWEQVAATDFDARAPLLAAEAAASRPAVIGLQEATVWRCRGSLFGDIVPVFDFTDAFLAATAAAGVPYVVAEADGGRAENPGYAIGPLPGLTVTDPATFQPLFGKDSADCGFQIGDVLLVRADLADQVQAAGTSEYDDRTTIVPTVLSIDRGYAWADIEVGGTSTRFVTTHLESLWDPDEVPVAALQARQLVADLAATTSPLVVMGDFNSDPRDPRGDGAANPAGQPEASAACPAQDPADPDPTCSAYWTMRAAGYTSAGPADDDPAYATWGSSALLAGPDPQRLRAALPDGNTAGYTDRLDYVFLRNGATVRSAALVGEQWPGGDTWACDDPQQEADTAAAMAVLREAGVGDLPDPAAGICVPTDHVGVVATVAVAGPADAPDEPLPRNDPFRLVWWHVLLGALVGIVLLVLLLRRARRRRRARRSAQR
jgi:endonuclease/exonuclease/phosphatase family metal-dependent hydrolase